VGVWAGWALALGTSHAELQFDVFLGYDSVVREGNWFPVAFEVHNDGTTFTGVIELANERIGTSQARRIKLELPTNTRKRVVIPVFASAGRYASWEAKLIDERGRVRAERTGIRPKDLASASHLLGAVARASTGLPALPQIQAQAQESQPVTARLMPEYFPDSAIALEGLSALYLNTEKALDLRAPQVEALLSWLHGGGHVILAVEQAADVNGTPWLRQLVPGQFTASKNHPIAGRFQTWLVEYQERGATNALGSPFAAGTQRLVPAPAPRRNARNAPAQRLAEPAELVFDPYRQLAPDPAFDATQLSVVSSRLTEGEVCLRFDETPVIVTVPRGRGRLTILTFSPEREPFRSWTNRAWFWAKLLETPRAWYLAPNAIGYAGWSVDGIFGAMLDSRQVRKLPVEWLLLLLVGYMAVIGPLDYFALKRLRRPMLTWITFPFYVAVFSALVYGIGFRLRHGDLEWNELSLVDLLPRAGGAERMDLRGRTYGSIYSPLSARYAMASEQPHATMRGELLGQFRGGQDASALEVAVAPRGFQASLTVPVWTSQLVVSDWLESGPAPLQASLARGATGLVLHLENRSGRTLPSLRLALDGRIHDLPMAPPGSSHYDLGATSNAPLSEFLTRGHRALVRAMQGRQTAFATGNETQLDDLPYWAAVISLMRLAPEVPELGGAFLAPAGLDLSQALADGQAVLLAWLPERSAVPRWTRFDARRGQRHTLYRLTVPQPPQR
jgi:hypothetical protein